MSEKELSNTVLAIKKCTNHIRGCRNILAEDYTKKRCEDCLRKEREKDKQKRDEAKAKQQGENMDGKTERVCTTCCKEYPIEDFVGIRPNTTTKTCKTCREQNNKQSSKRDKEHRNELARICSKKPEQIARKKAWNENNYEKCAEIWQRYRQKQIENDTEEYLRKNAEHAKKWRESNPEKYLEQLEKAKTDIGRSYTTYKRCAIIRNIPFELSFEEFENIIKTPCYYCGEFTKNYPISGIDRTDSKGPYNLNNVRSCCTMCNMMKNTLNQYTFLRRIEHILTFQQTVQGRLFPEVFNNIQNGIKKSVFGEYKTSAKKRNIEFAIELEFFRKTVSYDCYLCGKNNTQDHQNGIDRFDNNIGYLPENCRPCCFNCNLMKKDYDYDEFIRKMLLIYNLHKDDDFENTVIVGGVAPSNKLTKEELDEYRSQQKEKRIDQLKERYTDEQIKQNAALIAERRTQIKTQTNPVADV